MRTLEYFMILVIILLMVLMFGIHRDIQNLKEQLEIDSVETNKAETDNAYECQKFPCYTAIHKYQWVSQKYLTKGAM